VADFGLARRTDEAGQTASGAVLGTPSYMAPEQARGRGRKAGPAADVYALGAVLYECLTGRPPFKEESALDTLMAVASDLPLPPRRVRPDVPSELEAICLRCLEKDPARRFHSAAELADALRTGQAGTAEASFIRWRLPARVSRGWLVLVGLGIMCVGLSLGAWRLHRLGPAIPGEATPTPDQGSDSSSELTQTLRQGAPFTPSPDRASVSDLETPVVEVRVVQKPDEGNDLVLALRARPADERDPRQRLGRVVIWLDDSGLPLALKPDKQGAIDSKVIIERKNLRPGDNRILVQCYNEAGGCRQKEVLDSAGKPLAYIVGVRRDSDLYALCVGINDYSKAKGQRPESLHYSEPDAREMARVLKQHEGSSLYRKSTVELVPQDRATAEEILARLKALGKKARRADWLVLYLSGHGEVERDDTEEIPGSFYYVCADHNSKDPTTKLTSKRLYDVLADIPCGKFLILDVNHSGDVAINPLRDLMRDGLPFLVFSSCSPAQTALEPLPGVKQPPGVGKHGLFTQALLDTLGDSTRASGKRRLTPVTARDLARGIRSRLPVLLRKLRQPEDAQTPMLAPAQHPDDLPPSLFVLCKP
jgi:serine/threonine protein kinase